MSRLIRVLDDVPELADHLHGDDLAAARRAAVAVGQRLAPGPWAPNGVLSGAMGGIVRDGLLLRESTFAGAAATSLVGPGDLVLSPAGSGGTLTAFTTSWHVLEPTTMLWLGPTFERASRHWPVIGRSLLRLAQESIERAQAYQAIARLQRVDDRLIALLWHLAERWGRVNSEGIVIPLRLTHRVMAELIGARRPSVTTALGQLAAEGRVAREGGGWLLRGALPTRIPDLDWEACRCTGGSCVCQDATTSVAIAAGRGSAPALSPAPVAMPQLRSA